MSSFFEGIDFRKRNRNELGHDPKLSSLMIKILEIIEKMSLVKIRWPTFMYCMCMYIFFRTILCMKRGEFLWRMVVVGNFL